MNMDNSTPLLPPPSKDGLESKNRSLMLEMGSTTGRYDPLPPDHHIWEKNHGNAIERVMGWIYEKTIAYSHSAIASTRRGQPLHAKHCSQDLNMPIGTVWFALAELQNRDLIQVRKHEYIRLNAHVKGAMKKKRTKGDTNSETHQGYSNKYLYLLHGLEGERLEYIRRRVEALDALERSLFSDAAMTVREHIREIEHSIAVALGKGKKTRAKKPVHKKRALTISIDRQSDLFLSATGTLNTSEFTLNTSEFYSGAAQGSDLISVQTLSKQSEASQPAVLKERPPAATNGWLAGSVKRMLVLAWGSRLAEGPPTDQLISRLLPGLSTVSPATFERLLWAKLNRVKSYGFAETVAKEAQALTEQFAELQAEKAKKETAEQEQRTIQTIAACKRMLSEDGWTKEDRQFAAEYLSSLNLSEE